MNNDQQVQLAGWLQSSMDPATVSNSIRGAAVALSGTVLLVLALMGHPATTDQLGTTVDQVATLGGQLAAGLGAAWTLYGLVMKGVMWLHGPVVAK